MADLTLRAPIIDAHVQLRGEGNANRNILDYTYGQFYHEIDEEEYHEAIGPVRPDVVAYIFVETDRIRDPDNIVDLDLARGEASSLFNRLNKCSSPRCAAAILFAPMLLDNKDLVAYVRHVESVFRGTIRIAGFRFRLQGKPSSVIRHPNFFDNLMWLGARGYTFDLAMAPNSAEVLRDIIWLVRKLGTSHGVDGKVMPNLIIDQMGGLTMDLDRWWSDREYRTRHFSNWKMFMGALSAVSKVFVKLYGLFAERASLLSSLHIDSDPQGRQKAVSDILDRVTMYIQTCLTLFGPKRCIFASNYPLENYRGGGNKAAWLGWHTIMKAAISGRGPFVAHRFWWLNALDVYSIPIEQVPELAELLSTLDEQNRQQLLMHHPVQA